MSGFQSTPARIIRANSYIRDRWVRRGLSRLLTTAYSWLGFAHRQVLINQLRQAGTNISNHDLILDQLEEQGVLKGRFRQELGSLDKLEPHMISGRTTQAKIEAMRIQNFDADPVFAARNRVLSILAVGIPSGFYTMAANIYHNETLAAIFSSGAKYAGCVAKVVGGIGLGAGALWLLGLPSGVTPGLVLAGLTATCLIAAKYNTSLPTNHRVWGKVAKLNRFLSRKAAWVIYPASGGYLGYLVFQANLNIVNIFDSIGLEGSLAFGLGLAYAMNHYIKGKIKGFYNAFGSMLDPGTKKAMRKMISSMAYSSVAEVHYIGTRLMLLGGATAYMIANTLETMGSFGLIPLALPIAGILTHIGLRAKNYFSYQNPEQAKLLDKWKVWTPFYGLAAGGIASLIAGAGTALYHGAADLFFLGPTIYFTLFGSLATLFLNEIHGAYHSLNTNLGGMQAMQTSGTDLMGEQERAELLEKHSRILAINPHTGTHEHTLGLLFSVLLNRRPGISFICMFDLIPAQAGFKNLDNHRLEKRYIETIVTPLQKKVFALLYQGVNEHSDLTAKYEQLISNLRAAADYYDNELRQQLETITKTEGMFSPQADVAEARRAIFQELAIRAEQFRAAANRLERQKNKGQISAADFYQKWRYELECFDPDYMTKIPVARKSLAGDERKVRKVENVATGLILRGLTIYKGWGKEVEADRLPPEDWISGTWTKVPNPVFRYDASPGGLAASKFIWIRREKVWNKLQERNEDYLSSSKEIASVDNTPSVEEGFAPGSQPLAIDVNGEPVEVEEYYYVTGPDQDIVPSVIEPNFRPGHTELRPGYQLATYNHRPDADMRPYVFTPPAFDYTIMMDKNDVQVNTAFMPAFLKRWAKDIYIHLVRRQPVRRLFKKISYEFDNPLHHLEKRIDQSQGIQVVDANIELSRTDENGREFILPYKVDRSAAHVGINESAVWQSMSGAWVRMGNGEIAEFSLIYDKFLLANKNETQNVTSVVRAANGGQITVTYEDGETETFDPPAGIEHNTDEVNYSFEITPNKKQIWVASRLEMPLPPRDHPDYIDSLFLPENCEAELDVNAFTGHTAQQREGDMSWVRITYSDGSVAFARTTEGVRPMLNNKDLHKEPVPTYYEIDETSQPGKIIIKNVKVQRGSSIFVPRGWDRGLKEGIKLFGKGVNNSGDIYIHPTDGEFTPLPAAEKPVNHRGQMLGKVFTYDRDGNEVGEAYVVPLGNYVRKNRVEHLQAAIEIVPTEEGQLKVVECRMESKGLVEDRSKYVYNLTAAGAKEVEDNILDLAWIKDVRVEKEQVIVTYETPESAVPKILTLNRICFRDNDGKSLLANKSANMREVGDLYQAHDGIGRPRYTQETERFKPKLDVYKGNLRLVVHKTKTRKIEGIELRDIPEGGTVNIFPAAADAAVQLEDGTWVPLALKEPLSHLDEIDYNFSQVNEGVIKQVIGPQTRFGEPNNISSEYVRDPYFYGLLVEALFTTIEKYGDNFAINRAKSVRAGRGIQSGRTHVMPWQLLYNEMADVLGTNNPFLKKLSNFAEEIWGPGVSEDTQMEMAYWLKGIRMWVIKEMVALMAAEKKWGNYNAQNTTRYDYSEVLFNLSFLLSRCDILEGRLLGRQPVMMSWAEMAEITAGKTWYKVPFAKLIEQSAIPLYLLTCGHILWYPVDLAYFVGSWLFRTIASSVNYTKHLVSLGYGFVTGFWKNPALELTMLRGYFQGAIRQWLMRNQYATFMKTVGGSDKETIDKNTNWIRTLAIPTGISLAASAVLMTLAGLHSWMLLPLGLAALPFGLSKVAKGLSQYKGLKKYAVAAGGAAAIGSGLVLAALGLPALTNFLSIALIANLGFGLYQFGLLWRSLRELRQVRKEMAEKPNYKNMSAELANRHAQVAATLRRERNELSYDQLRQLRQELREVLKEIKIMDSNGEVIMGTKHEYRQEGFKILDTYADLEMVMCTRAVSDLINNGNSAEARDMLLNLLLESRESLVIGYAAQAYRRFNFKLNLSFRELARRKAQAFAS